MNLSKFDDVNEVLDLLSADLQKFLGKKLVALYLTGSLSYGDFDYGSSDIDFLAVLTKELTPKQLEAVKEMHNRIGRKVPYWSKRLEGSYIPRKWLNSINRPSGKRPYVNGGTVNMYPYGNEWPLNLYVLYQCGIALVGQNPKKLIPPVDIKDVREASKKNLLEEWAPKLKEKDPFFYPGYDSSHLQVYAILTMCRILHRAKIDSIASKKEASIWVKKAYRKQWSDLIEEAENWKHGIKLDKQEETKAFIKFVIEEINPTDNSPGTG
jgi:hypothetical protein